jgi:hypothetical protein
MTIRVPKFAVATRPKPILSTPDFQKAFGGNDGSTIDLAKKVETCALTGTKFSILAKNNDVYKVTTKDYPSDELYIDASSLDFFEEEPDERKKIELPSKDILQRLWSFEGKRIPYLWGGNCPEGIPELLTSYPPKKELSSEQKKLWTMTGTDCSGLLYAVTNGFTPRNTSQLVTFGDSLSVEGKNKEEIVDMLAPLDLIVWVGHVVIVLNREKTIESRDSQGVMITNTLERIREVMEKNGRKPINRWPPSRIDTKNCFVIQRWCSESRLAMRADQPV